MCLSSLPTATTNPGSTCQPVPRQPASEVGEDPGSLRLGKTQSWVPGRPWGGVRTAWGQACFPQHTEPRAATAGAWTWQGQGAAGHNTQSRGSQGTPQEACCCSPQITWACCQSSRAGSQQAMGRPMRAPLWLPVTGPGLRSLSTRSGQPGRRDEGFQQHLGPVPSCDGVQMAQRFSALSPVALASTESRPGKPLTSVQGQRTSAIRRGRGKTPTSLRLGCCVLLTHSLGLREVYAPEPAFVGRDLA